MSRRYVFNGFQFQNNFIIDDDIGSEAYIEPNVFISNRYWYLTLCYES